FMAGRNVSVTHKALGTVRVMKTCGMMGVVVGKAATLSAEHDCSPRDVYYQHLPELIKLMQLPGHMRREKIGDEFTEDPNLPKMEEPELNYIPINKLSGIVIDDDKAKMKGKWSPGAGLKNYIENGYHYASSGSGATATFEFEVPTDGDYEVRFACQPHENRSSKTPVTVHFAGGEKTVTLNQKVAPPLQYGFYTLGIHPFKKGETGKVVVSTEGIDGNAHIDAVQVLKQK
ncbi:MAG: FAD-dependent oxidoreductase, partial [Verrucomicrobiales bacterium]|nr:FAD-dependent oxidoreductase [Verrucomicrobiales bacterium]